MSKFIDAGQDDWIFQVPLWLPAMMLEKKTDGACMTHASQWKSTPRRVFIQTTVVINLTDWKLKPLVYSYRSSNNTACKSLDTFHWQRMVA